MSKLLLEPGNHPEAAVDEHFDVPGIGQGGRPGKITQLCVFDILIGNDLHCRAGPKADHGNRRINGAGTEQLALFITGTDNDRQAFRQSCGLRGLRCNMPKHLIRRIEINAVSVLNSKRIVDKIERLAVPLFAFVIKGPDTGNHTAGIAKFAGEFPHKKSRSLNELVRFTVYFGFILHDPQKF
ncbi:MAG: hypothetical protein BWY07_02784 [Candidatus Hydrogenedentes bacterium ADurb.Bin170]|nr:MAG: hypothetical protein BWY07_02784 [Candidatus Hydrogenedentes bacterium ADurb.Bin170]